MPQHFEKRVLPYPSKALFDIVADVEKYSDFLPWCLDCRITKRQDNLVWANLKVGFNVFQETFTSKVVLSEPDRIDIEYIKGPFRYLHNYWRFLPNESGKNTELEFFIDFEFNSRLLRVVATPVFNEAVSRMVFAFEKRAQLLIDPTNSV